MDIDTLLEQRAETHGDFTAVNALYTDLSAAIYNGNLDVVNPDSIVYYQYAVDAILSKLSRAIAGNPAEPDHWKDIAGYAMLVVKQLERDKVKYKNNQENSSGNN